MKVSLNRYHLRPEDLMRPNFVMHEFAFACPDRVHGIGTCLDAVEPQRVHLGMDVFR